MYNQPTYIKDELFATVFSRPSLAIIVKQLKGSVKEPNISIYFFFPPITQRCSISDVLHCVSIKSGPPIALSIIVLYGCGSLKNLMRNTVQQFLRKCANFCMKLCSMNEELNLLKVIRLTITSGAYWNSGCIAPAFVTSITS